MSYPEKSHKKSEAVTATSLLRRQVKRRHSSGKCFLPPLYFFCFSVRPHAIYYLGILRLYTQSCHLIRCPGSKTAKGSSDADLEAFKGLQKKP
jgi:hypothetical protein